LLSTISGTSFNDFYTDANRLVDQTAAGTFGSSIGVNNTQVPTYVSMIGTDGSQGKSEFLNRFIDKYTKIALSQNSTSDYTHTFDSKVSGVSTLAAPIYKIPTREIYVYNGTTPLYLSDHALSNNNA
jgi:hypothetical protein